MRDFVVKSEAETMGLSFYPATTWKALGQVLGGNEGKEKIQGKWREFLSQEAQGPGEEPDTWITIKQSQKLKYMA